MSEFLRATNTDDEMGRCEADYTCHQLQPSRFAAWDFAKLPRIGFITHWEWYTNALTGLSTRVTVNTFSFLSAALPKSVERRVITDIIKEDEC